jgi:hypothetical protein
LKGSVALDPTSHTLRAPAARSTCTTPNATKGAWTEEDNNRKADDENGAVSIDFTFIISIGIISLDIDSSSCWGGLPELRNAIEIPDILSGLSGPSNCRDETSQGTSTKVSSTSNRSTNANAA